MCCGSLWTRRFRLESRTRAVQRFLHQLLEPDAINSLTVPQLLFFSSPSPRRWKGKNSLKEPPKSKTSCSRGSCWAIVLGNNKTTEKDCCEARPQGEPECQSKDLAARSRAPFSSFTLAISNVLLLKLHSWQLPVFTVERCFFLKPKSTKEP